MRTIRNDNHINLSSSEISALWMQYMGDSMAICVYKYFHKIVEDKEIKSIINFSLRLAEVHIANITEFFTKANFLIPKGFTEYDVNLSAPRLFSDQFILFYSKIMTSHGMGAYSLAVTSAEHPNIQDYFFECLKSSKELYQQITMLGHKKSIFSSVPGIPSPEKVEFYEKTDIIANLVGNKRPLNTAEIGNLFYNSKKTGLIRSLSIAFAQVASREDVRNFMQTNMKLSGKDVDSFNAILKRENFPIPKNLDNEITDSTISPFSDKLMMFHAAFLVNASLSYYGAALGTSLRSDIMVIYQKVWLHALEVGALCYKILVKHKWLEKQPESITQEIIKER